MSAFDFIFVIVLLASVVYGFRKGLLKQLGSLAGVLAGIVLARAFSDDFAQWLAGFESFAKAVESSPEIIKDYIPVTTASIILFLAGFLAVKILAAFISFTLKPTPLSVVNRLAGAAFSAFFFFLLLSAFMNFCQIFKPDGSVLPESTLFNDKVAEFVMDLAPSTFGVTKYAVLQSELPGNLL